MASSSTFLKNGFRGFLNASIKFSKTLGKHISLNIGEREEKKRLKSNPKHFGNASVSDFVKILHHSSPFFVRSSSFFSL